MTEGPFFPDRLPLDTDNDLLVITDAVEPADGEITWLSGRILDAAGAPLRNSLVEIWQVDGHGAYLHSRTGNAENRDRRFPGYGRFATSGSSTACSSTSDRSKARGSASSPPSSISSSA